MVKDLAMLFLALVVAALVHEEGHWITARLLGYPARFVLTWAGPGTSWGSDERISSQRDRLLVSAAGPLANVVFAMEAVGMGWTTVGLVSLLFGAVQLIPVGPSDGRNMLRAMRGTR